MCRWLRPVVVVAALTGVGFLCLACDGGPDGATEEVGDGPGAAPESQAPEQQLDERDRQAKFREHWERRRQEFLASSDKDSEEARQAFEQEYESAQREEHLRRIKGIVNAANKDFEFSGRIIDEEGSPLSGVVVEALISVMSEDLQEFRDYVLVTADKDGSFHFKGRGIGIRLAFQKSGYSFSRDHSFSLDTLSDAEVREFNRGRPKTIQAKRQPLDPSDDLHTGLRYKKVVANGSFEGVDIDRWTDLVQVSLTRAADGSFDTPSSWSASVRITNGEIQKAPSQLLDEAPLGGYRDQWSVTYDEGSDDWSKHKSHTFFFRADDRRVHGGLTVFFRPYYNSREESSVVIDYVVNATGSRTLLPIEMR